MSGRRRAALLLAAGAGAAFLFLGVIALTAGDAAVRAAAGGLTVFGLAGVLLLFAEGTRS